MCFVECAEIRTKRLDDSVFQLRSRSARKANKNVVFSMAATARSVSKSQPYLRGTICCHIGEYSNESVKKGYQWRDAPAFKVSFVLSRTGKLTLQKLILGDRLKAAVAKNGDAAIDYLFKQSYFFLKDMVHRHRHHRNTDDTFIECTRGGEGYKKVIAYQLGKRLIRRPIEKDGNTYQSALGILAYLRTYQSSTGTHVYSDEGLTNISSSLSAEYTVSQNNYINRKWLGAAALSIYTYVSSKAAHWDNGLDLISGNPTSIKQSSTILGFIIISIVTAYFSGVINPTRWFWFQELLKVPSALQTRDKFFRRSKIWVFIMLLMTLSSIFMLNVGSYIFGATLLALLFMVFLAYAKTLYRVATGRHLNG